MLRRKRRETNILLNKIDENMSHTPSAHDKLIQTNHFCEKCVFADIHAAARQIVILRLLLCRRYDLLPNVPRGGSVGPRRRRHRVIHALRLVAQRVQADPGDVRHVPVQVRDLEVRRGAGIPVANVAYYRKSSMGEVNTDLVSAPRLWANFYAAYAAVTPKASDVRA